MMRWPQKNLQEHSWIPIKTLVFLCYLYAVVCELLHKGGLTTTQKLPKIKNVQTLPRIPENSTNICMLSLRSCTRAAALMRVLLKSATTTQKPQKQKNLQKPTTGIPAKARVFLCYPYTVVCELLHKGGSIEIGPALLTGPNSPTPAFFISLMILVSVLLGILYLSL